jgi:hypothetical protein
MVSLCVALKKWRMGNEYAIFVFHYDARKGNMDDIIWLNIRTLNFGATVFLLFGDECR